MQKNTVVILQENILFKNLSADEIQKIDNFIQPIEFPEESKIIQQGKTGNGLYVIITGKVSVDVQLFGDMSVHIANLGSSDIIGEVTLIENRKASATVTTKAPTQCFFLSTSYYQALQLSYPEIAHKISTVIAEIMCERIKNAINQVAGVLDDIPEINPEKRHKLVKTTIKATTITPKFASQHRHSLETLTIFKIFTSAELSVLINYLGYVELKKHSIIYNAGETVDACYLVIFGAIQAIAYKHNKIAKLWVSGPNDLAGQLGFISKQPSDITFFVRENADLLEISHNNLKKLHDNHPIIYYKFMHILFASLGELLLTADVQLLRLQAQNIIAG
jgi:CRP-like cAMP-binding protein